MSGEPKTADKALLDRLSGYAYQPGVVSPRHAKASADAAKNESSTPARASSSTPSKSSGKRRKIDLGVGYERSPVDSAARAVGATRASQASPGDTGTPSKRKPRPFAGPEVYAHLNPVTDHLKPDLKFVFCGINPGKMSSTLGHHFAHPTNKFWKALHLSVPPNEDASMPDLYSFGLTNLCDRPTSEQSELSPLEMKLNVYNLTLKIQRFRPRVVCFVGKKIWDVYESVVSKTAGPMIHVHLSSVGSLEVKEDREDWADGQLVKLEEDDLEDLRGGTVPMVNRDSEGKVKLEPPDPQASVPTRATQHKSDREASTPTRSKGKSKETMEWTKPRPFRLPNGAGYTYFWVTPNTSGLERTPLSEQVVIFSHLRQFADSLASGDENGAFRNIDVTRVAETVEAIRVAAEKKARAAMG